VGMIARGVQCELADRIRGGDAPDYAPKLAVIKCDKPEVAVRLARNTGQLRESSRYGKLADPACGGDARDLEVLVVGIRFDKPQVPVWSSRDTVRVEVRSGQGEFA